MKIQENVSLAQLTTMRLGGPARFLITIDKLSDLQLAFDFVKDHQLPVFFLGGGANLIARDEGFDGILIKNQIKGVETIHQDDDSVVLEAMGGEIWDDFTRHTAQLGYSGIEAMAKIPGTVGAAPVQNIGAYGQEIKDTLLSVQVYDRKLEKITTLSLKEIDFRYRRSIFNLPENKNRFFVISLQLKLHRCSLQPPFYTSLQKYIDEHHITDFSPFSIYQAVSAVRTAKLPDPEHLASAGSFFKNIILPVSQTQELDKKHILYWPAGDGQVLVNSGWLIEHAGLKGQLIHGFRVSDKAALILINESATGYADLAKARAAIIKTVWERFGLTLEQEPVELY